MINKFMFDFRILISINSNSYDSYNYIHTTIDE